MPRSGCEGFSHELPADVSQGEVEQLLAELGADDRVSGILLQLPTPDHIDGPHLTTLIDPLKDVDGLTPVSAGLLAKGLPGLRPCTPSGVIELLRRHDVELVGAEAVVVGARTWSASRSRRCSWPSTRRSRSATRAPATWARSAAARTC